MLNVPGIKKGKTALILICPDGRLFTPVLPRGESAYPSVAQMTYTLYAVVYENIIH